MSTRPRVAVILAAGEGRRLRPLTDTCPKPLLPVCGEPILLRALRAFAGAGVTESCVVTGHLGEMIRARLGERCGEMRIRYLHCPSYASTNSMFSLHMALQESVEAAWVLEGDVVFDPRILELEAPDAFCWYTATYRPDLDGAFLSTNRDGYATGLQIVREKNLPPDRSARLRKSVGLLLLQTGAAAALRDWLQVGVHEGKQHLYYDLIVQEHLGTFPIRVLDVGDSKWCEIDTPEDLAAACALFGTAERPGHAR